MISAESPPLEMGLHISMNWKGYKLGNGGGEFSISLSKFNYNENNKTCNNELLMHDKALRSSPPNSSMGKIFKWTNVVGKTSPQHRILRKKRLIQQANPTRGVTEYYHYTQRNTFASATKPSLTTMRSRSFISQS